MAAASGNSILIIDFYTGDKIADLRGHNSKVSEPACMRVLERTKGGDLKVN